MPTKKPPTKKAPAKKTRRPLTIDDVRDLALALPDTEERPSYGTPGFRAKDTLFARVLDDERVVVRTDLTWRDELLAAFPEVFTLTPHYEPHPWVIVQLVTIGRERMQEVLAEARELVLAGKKRKARTR